MADLRIKICGITNLADARVAVEAGTHYLGFIFYASSPRYVQVETVRHITDVIRADYKDKAPFMVGVFVNEAGATITDKMLHAGLDLAQLSGDESPELLKTFNGRAYKTIRPRNLKEAELDV
ncbi:MAG TPA: hypothetical protein VJZ27_03600, partial [Aggregatilineales bacterium]|nr:hypothetical protein [Aggregatilineales bacterium]